MTEQVTGVDLVAAQMRIAADERIEGVAEAAIDDHAVEARVYAEDSATLLPSSGRLQVFRPTFEMTGVRVDVAYAEGQTVSPYYVRCLPTPCAQRLPASARHAARSRHYGLPRVGVGLEKCV